MRQDSGWLITFNSFHNGCSGTVGINHRITVVRIGYSRKNIRTYHYPSVIYSAPDVGIGNDHSLGPTRTARYNIVTYTCRIFNIHLGLDLVRKTGQKVNLSGTRIYIAKIVGNNKEIKCFRIYSCRFTGIFHGNCSHIRIHHIITEPPAFTNIGYFLEFLNNLIVAFLQRLFRARIKKSIIPEIFVLNGK